MANLSQVISNFNSLIFNEQYRKISDYVADYIVHKTEHLYADCCKTQQSDHQPNTEHWCHFSRRTQESINAAMPLGNAVSQVFAP